MVEQNESEKYGYVKVRSKEKVGKLEKYELQLLDYSIAEKNIVIEIVYYYGKLPKL